ncbi:MAG TPA: FmdB family zinc ribbon protein [Acidimicrobiia bacterium]|nr:FmdB family zinc ribbon protein [Acidimicrobiia bacterium]
MPTYVYECNKCGDEFELYQSFSDEPLKKHPDCGGKVAKVFQPVGIVLKGSGFYKNDSRNGAKRSNGNAAKTESSSESDSKPESTKSESTKSEKSSDAKGSGADTKKSDSSSSTTKKKSDSSTSTVKSS